MRLDRYALWTAVWQFFQVSGRLFPLSSGMILYELLNQLWQDERKDATPEELAAHAGALNKLRDQFKPKDDVQ